MCTVTTSQRKTRTIPWKERGVCYQKKTICRGPYDGVTDSWRALGNVDSRSHFKINVQTSSNKHVYSPHRKEVDLELPRISLMDKRELVLVKRRV